MALKWTTQFSAFFDMWNIPSERKKMGEGRISNFLPFNFKLEERKREIRCRHEISERGNIRFCNQRNLQKGENSSSTLNIKFEFCICYRFL